MESVNNSFILSTKQHGEHQCSVNPSRSAAGQAVDSTKHYRHHADEITRRHVVALQAFGIRRPNAKAEAGILKYTGFRITAISAFTLMGYRNKDIIGTASSDAHKHAAYTSQSSDYFIAATVGEAA
jgi:hypothetical protein